MLPDQLQLLVGGRTFTGWKSVRVRRSMVRCSGDFELGVSWEGRFGPGVPPIRVGDSCELRIDGDLVLSGYVDQLEAQIDEQRHDVTVAGRDKTADLVDCSAVRKSGQWRAQKIETIAADLAQPFGVEVVAAVDTGKALASFALQEGESVFEAIERAARLRALLLVSNASGALVITRAGQDRVDTALVLGKNVLAMRAARDMRDRFSSYVLKGQAPGSDKFAGPLTSQIYAKATDPDVPRHRPLIIVNDAPDVAATLAERARWEASVRAARSTTLEAEVQGWRHASGLWLPNSLVRVLAADLSIDDELLVTDVEYVKDEGHGTRCTLAMTRADAFTQLPLRASEVATAGAFKDWPSAVTAVLAR